MILYDGFEEHVYVSYKKQKQNNKSWEMGTIEVFVGG
jgi:hypothetical protein